MSDVEKVKNETAGRLELPLKEADDQEIKRWFDDVVSKWTYVQEDDTSGNLLEAIQYLGEKGWTFNLAVTQDNQPKGVPVAKREIITGSGTFIYDIKAAAIGYSNRENPFFVGVSRNYLTLSSMMKIEGQRGLIQSFKPIDYFSFFAVPPEKTSSATP